eukprot:5550383-Amphidinium_carterae.1
MTVSHVVCRPSQEIGTAHGLHIGNMRCLSKVAQCHDDWEDWDMLQVPHALKCSHLNQDGLDKNVIPASAADPYKVIGVSIAYDYYSSAPAIENALRQISQTWSDAYDEQHDRSSSFISTTQAERTHRTRACA